MSSNGHQSLRPLGDRLIVQAKSQQEVTRSGIVLPDTAQEKPQRGTVLAVGPGRLLDNGSREVVDVEVGQEILFAKYAGSEVKLDNVEYLILKASDVLAIVDE